MSEFTIIDAIEDPKLFRPLFKDLGTWAAWIAFLRAVFALPMTPAELEVYRQCTGREKPSAKPPSEVFAIVGRRGGKSFISAVSACYLALFHDWRLYLAAGETAWILVIATDREQARNILGYIKGILGSSRMLNREVEKDLTWEIGLKNGVGIKIGTCSFRALRGYTIVSAIADELAYWRSEGSNPAQEVLTAIRPAMATVPGSKLIGISSPYGKTGPLYEAFRDKYGQADEEVLIWKAPTRVMNPTIREAVIERAIKEDNAAARAEWLAEFREDLETYLPTEMIESVIVPGRYELPRIAGADYRAFCDPSGGRADSFSLAIAHKDEKTGRIVLDRMADKAPPFRPQDVVAEYAEILKSFGIGSISGDKYAGEWVAAAFRDQGIMFQSAEKTKSEIYLEFEPMVAQGIVELLDHKKLFNQLRGLERRTRSGGRDSVDHYPGGHDDLANSVAGVCVMAKGSGDGPRVWSLGPAKWPGVSEGAQHIRLMGQWPDWVLKR